MSPPKYRLFPALLRSAVQLVFDAGLGRFERFLPLYGKFRVPVPLVLERLDSAVAAAGAQSGGPGVPDEDAVAGELCEENPLTAVGQLPFGTIAGEANGTNGGGLIIAPLKRSQSAGGGNGNFVGWFTR